jgi:hypothetical protein
MARRNGDDWFGCLTIIGILLIVAIFNGIGELIKNFPVVMLCIFLGIGVIIAIIVAINNQKEKEAQQKREAERQLQAQIERERLAKLERERLEKERIEALKYETVTVVFAYIEEDGKPNAIIKRSNNTYGFVHRDGNIPYKVGETLKLLRTTTNSWNWVDEQEYQRRKAIKEKRALQLQEARDRQQRLEAIRKQKAEQKKLQLLYSSYKDNWREFQKILQEKNITKLYHFTDRANLQSIKQNGGLLSWAYCKQNNIAIPRPGGSELSWVLDRQKGLQNYVRLSFVADHPMLYVAQNDGRIVNPVILEISTDVIFKKETKFATRNAAKSGVMANGTIEKFNAIKFSVLRSRYFDLDENEKPFYQAEVLVWEKVPLDKILNINKFII